MHPVAIAFIKNVFEEWYDNIGLKVEEYNNLDWVDIIIDERKK